MLTKAELQRLRSLREKKAREALGLFVVEGEKVVAEMLASGVPLIEVYGTRAWRHRNPTQPSGPRFIEVTETEMARISHFPTPAAVLALGKIARTTVAPATLQNGLTLALDGVQDAGNVGTLLRIADWFAFDRVVMSADCADVFHQKVINASMGSFARVAAHVVDLPALLAEVRAGFPEMSILGCDLEGTDVHTLPALPDAIVVVGSEGRGLSTPVAAQLTRRVTIPRFGRAESLNAAIAAAIVCDCLRQKIR